MTETESIQWLRQNWRRVECTYDIPGARYPAAMRLGQRIIEAKRRVRVIRKERETGVPRSGYEDWRDNRPTPWPCGRPSPWRKA